MSHQTGVKSSVTAFRQRFNCQLHRFGIETDKFASSTGAMRGLEFA
jgi:hypothetical protein